MDFLRDWQAAPALVLSCPGPMRRHTAALLPLTKLALPQVFLGGESQLLAFAAAAPGVAGRVVFAPLPEMFCDPASLAAAWRALGQAPHSHAETVHLRFGSIRDARVLKGARNAAVIAEADIPPPLTTSRHPFASGRVLPAAMQRIFSYGPHCLRPAPFNGAPLLATQLPANCVTADLDAAALKKPPRGGPDGLDLISLADFRPDEWAAKSIGLQGAGYILSDEASGESRRVVLLPWNMAHFGSIVPELLKRLAMLRRPETGMPTILIMPFNYLGLTGMIRELIADLKEAAEHPDAVLKDMFLARVTRLTGIAALKALGPTCWLDGNDPEHWWSLARFTACGFRPIVIDPFGAPEPDHFAADDPFRAEADTRFGALSFDAHLPALRALPRLLALTTPLPRRRAIRRPPT